MGWFFEPRRDADPTDEDTLISFAGDDEAALPDPNALIDVANEHFAFFSAQSDEGREASSLEARVQGLESALKQIQMSLEALPSQLAATHSGPKPKSQLSKPVQVQPIKPVVGGLDPGILASARGAGIPEDQVARLAQLLAKPNTMTEGPPAAIHKKSVLSESEEDEVLIEGDGEVGKLPEAPLEKAVVQLTKLVTHMAQTKKGQPSSLEAILNITGGIGEGEGGSSQSSSGSGKTKAVAYQRLKSTLTRNPEALAKLVETLMEEDFHLARTAPGTASLPMTSRTDQSCSTIRAPFELVGSLRASTIASEIRTMRRRGQDVAWP